MNEPLNRRQFLRHSGVAAAALTAGGIANAAPALPPSTRQFRGRIYKSVKFGMFREDISILEKFELMKEMGYDGAELNTPGEDKKEALEASRATGLPIHGVVDTIHWNTRLSDPDPAVRARGLAGLKKAIEEAHYCGGSAVLLVPGKVTNAETENQDQVWERSSEQIRRALPLAAKLGVRILIENVWNGFCYIHDGPNDQAADLLARYIDTIDSPWVGVYFDIGNHQKYGNPANWIRTLGSRIVKLDVKDWGETAGFSKIGEGDVDWRDVRKALTEINFSGWCTAEVRGGDRKRIQEVAENVNRALGL